MAEITAFFKTIWDALLSFEFPSDLFDIVFVTFIIYEAIKFIRGSRSFHLIKGIVFIALVFFFVKLTRMEASEYLLSSVIENALIVLVVLFAPEIRNILERFGRRSITDFSLLNFRSNGAYKEEIKALVNDFCKAAGEMSETKTGALVVFEREAPLSEVI
jgi:diadenylate cyclase